MVGVAVRELVVGTVDQVPRDAWPGLGLGSGLGLGLGSGLGSLGLPSSRKTSMKASNAGTAAKNGTHPLPLRSPRSTSQGRRPAASATSVHWVGLGLGLGLGLALVLGYEDCSHCSRHA